MGEGKKAKKTEFCHEKKEGGPDFGKHGGSWCETTWGRRDVIGA